MRNRFHFPISEIPEQGLDLELDSTPGELHLKESDFVVSGPIQSKIRIERAEQTVILEGNIRGLVDLQCVRCLTNVSHPLDVSFRVFLEPPGGETTARPVEDRELKGEELDKQFFSGETILLEDVIREQVMLDVPAYPVCREKCLGLCPVCGINRNESRCSCPLQEENPPMSRLQEQLKKLHKKT